MKIPGFTGEASLYKTGEIYQIAAAWTYHSAEHMITPQQEQCPPSFRQTATACPLGGIFGLWCRDFCGPPEGNHPISGWYFCGICIGGDF